MGGGGGGGATVFHFGLVALLRVHVPKNQQAIHFLDKVEGGVT